MLTELEKREIDNELIHFPTKRAACIEALKIVQSQRRWISDESLSDIAEYLDMTTDELDNVATFYNLIFRKPVGRHVILVCDSVTCYIMGFTALLDYMKEKYNIKFGETTPDMRFTLLPIPCLGICNHSPAMIIDEDLHQDLNTENIDKILANYP